MELGMWTVWYVLAGIATALIALVNIGNIYDFPSRLIASIMVGILWPIIVTVWIFGIFFRRIQNGE